MKSEKQRMKELVKELYNAILANRIIDEIEVIDLLIKAKEQIKELDNFDRWRTGLSDTCPDAGKDNCLIACGECEHNK